MRIRRKKLSIAATVGLVAAFVVPMTTAGVILADGGSAVAASPHAFCNGFTGNVAFAGANGLTGAGYFTGSSAATTTSITGVSINDCFNNTGQGSTIGTSIWRQLRPSQPLHRHQALSGRHEPHLR